MLFVFSAFAVSTASDLLRMNTRTRISRRLSPNTQGFVALLSGGPSDSRMRAYDAEQRCVPDSSNRGLSLAV